MLFQKKEKMALEHDILNIPTKGMDRQLDTGTTQYALLMPLVQRTKQNVTCVSKNKFSNTITCHPQIYHCLNNVLHL